MLYDIIIIGAGPAGMTAAIYAARQKVKFLLMSIDLGGQMVWSSEVDNYPGIPDVSGIEMVQRFQKHIKDYNIKVKQEEVLEVGKKGKKCFVKTKKGVYKSKAVVIASGKKPKKLNVPGEEKFLGKGVNYCATCHAPSFKDKIVAVAGGGNSGLEAALFLIKYAKKVYLLEAMKNLKGETYLKNKVLQNKKVKIMTDVKIKEIKGEDAIKFIAYEKSGKNFKLPVDGIFIEIGLVAKVNFAKLVKKNKWGEIILYRSTKTHEENMTNIPGIFAAGDVTDIPAKQIVVAAGEGCKATLAAFDYINKFKEK